MIPPRTFNGEQLQAGGKLVFENLQNVREFNKWKTAIEELETAGFIKRSISKRVEWEMTESGFSAVGK